MARKQLITEADVRKMAPGGELVLGADRIATPAALDAAFGRGIRVVYADLAAAAASELWTRMKRQDGSYIVEVKGGRAVVTRLGPAGPEAFGAE